MYANLVYNTQFLLGMYAVKQTDIKLPGGRELKPSVSLAYLLTSSSCHFSFHPEHLYVNEVPLQGPF